MSFKKNGFVVNDDNANLGVISITSKPGSKRYKVRLSHHGERYTYDLNNRGATEVYPLQMGNGTYVVSVMEQTSGNQYRSLFSASFNVAYEHEYVAFLQPNQYAWYQEDSPAVVKAAEIAGGLQESSKKADAIVSYITRSFLYDHFKAITMPATGTYIPNLDSLMDSKKGICFDLAALVCCMMRSQGIPTKMVIGETDRGYHAWNRILVDGQWRLVDVTDRIAAMEIRKYSPQLYY